MYITKSLSPKNVFAHGFFRLSKKCLCIDPKSPILSLKLQPGIEALAVARSQDSSDNPLRIVCGQKHQKGFFDIPEHLGQTGFCERDVSSGSFLLTRIKQKLTPNDHP